MVSGKYSALSGAVARLQSMDNISANLANVSTTGYKRSDMSFESILRGAQQIKQANGINYTRVKGNFTDFSNGPINKTGSPLDVAMGGPGFFKVQGPNGILYTRDGHFTLDSEGRLLTSAHQPVLDNSNTPITIPGTDTNIVSISSIGVVSVIAPGGSQTDVGTLGIVTVDDPLKLKNEGNTSYSLQTGAQEVPVDQPNVIQGGLEISNVNMVKEMADMITNQRTYETYNNVLKSYSAIDAEQDNLGTLSS